MKTNTERLEFYYNQGFEFILTKKIFSTIFL